MSIGVPFPEPALYAGYHLADANDFSGNSRTLTAGGSPIYARGKFGNGMESDGNDTLYRGTFGLAKSSPLTATIWYKVTAQPATSQVMEIFDLRTGVSPQRKAFYFDYKRSAGGVYSLLIGIGTDSHYTYEWTGQLTTGSWHFIALSYNGSNSALIMLDGDIRVLAVADSYYTSSNYDLISLAMDWEGATPLTGQIDECCIYNEAKTRQWLMRQWAWSKGLLNG